MARNARVRGRRLGWSYASAGTIKIHQTTDLDLRSINHSGSSSIFKYLFKATARFSLIGTPHIQFRLRFHARFSSFIIFRLPPGQHTESHRSKRMCYPKLLQQRIKQNTHTQIMGTSNRWGSTLREDRIAHPISQVDSVNQ